MWPDIDMMAAQTCSSEVLKSSAMGMKQLLVQFLLSALSPPHPLQKFVLILSYQPNFSWYLNFR